MAWYDLFTGNSISKHARRIGDRDAQPDDRMASAHWLSDQGTEESLLALARRFDLQLEHQIKDRNEKEAVIELLVGHSTMGSAAARRHASGSPNFQHSLGVIERVEGADAAVSVLLGLLEAESVDNEFKPEKKRTLLLTAAERKDPRIVAASARFLVDFDEGVRHAAVEAIAAQAGDEGMPLLASALCNPREESTRVRGRVADVFVSRGWPAPADPWLQQNLPIGFRLVDGRLHR